MLEEEHADFEDYQIDVQEKWDVPKKNANIKIYRPDKTYNTLHVPLNSTTLEILKKLATKFFMSDMTKFNLVMKRHNIGTCCCGEGGGGGRDAVYSCFGT